MNQDDPEVRVAGLESQPAARQNTAAHKRASRSLRRGSGRKDLHWWIVALIPVLWVVWNSFGLTGVLIALVAFVVVAVGIVALTWRGLDGEKIVGGIIGALGGLFGVVTVLKIQVPSSVLWMSGIVCSSPYHLERDVSHYACVSGESSYDVNDFMVLGLQALLVALVLFPVVAVGLLIRRRLQTRF